MNWTLVRSLKSEIIAAAKYHERPEVSFGWDTVAALMGAHIAKEKRLEARVYDWLGDASRLVGRVNASTGIANTRPRTVAEILRGEIGGEVGQYLYQLACEDEFSFAFVDGVVDEYDYTGISDALQDNVVALDILGANIEQGINEVADRGLTASVMNVGNWLWSGVVEPKEWWRGLETGSAYSRLFRWGGHGGGYTHGFTMISQFRTSAAILGVNPVNANLYNVAPGDPIHDESPFARCEIAIAGPAGVEVQGTWLTTTASMYYRQNATCGNQLLSRSQFLTQYGNTLRQLDLDVFSMEPVT